VQYYADFLRWSWGAAVINQWEHQPDATVVSGVTVLDYFSLEGQNKWVFLAVEVGFLLLFSVLAWAALAFVKHGKR
jgi:ATP-binding cassette, subfamily G (WHITE), member 2